jgi:hypothetical protein
MTAEQLQKSAEATVQKGQDLGTSLKKAAQDKDAIQLIASKPATKVKDQFAGRSKDLEGTIKKLQNQVNTRSEGADFEKEVQQVTNKVKELRDDEIDALDQAHHQATEAARHAARGAQSEVRSHARQVWAMADEMSRRDAKLQDAASKLESRAEEAADVVESNSEELARCTQDHLEDNLSKAKAEVRKEARRRFSTLNEVTGQSESRTDANAKRSAQSAEVTDKQSHAFLAQRAVDNLSTPAYVSYFAAVVLAVAGLVLYVKLNYRQAPVNMHYTMLG